MVGVVEGDNFVTECVLRQGGQAWYKPDHYGGVQGRGKYEGCRYLWTPQVWTLGLYGAGGILLRI